MPEEYAVGATARATTTAGTPRASDQTAASPGPATKRNWLPSRHRGGGGSVSPAAAAACAAFSAEKVNSALTRRPTWNAGSPVTPRGSSFHPRDGKTGGLLRGGGGAGDLAYVGLLVTSISP